MIKLVSDTIDKQDIEALTKWLNQDDIPRLTKGELTWELERKWAQKIGTKYSVFVNSGSSAILLALAAAKEMGLLPNKKVIVSGLSWATDVSSPILLGLEPILCDCNLTDLSCDLEHLESLFQQYPGSCFILVSPLGLVPDMDAIINLCNKYRILLFEDVCESMGSKYGREYLGSFGFASFFSMYFGHHLSTIEGGFINTDSEEFYYYLLMMRSHGWDRDLPDDLRKELRKHSGVSDFEALYNFYVPGFNLRATDLQAFIGLRAIDKLNYYSLIRNENFEYYRTCISSNLSLRNDESNFISNFAFPVTSINRNRIVENLRAADIEVRPLIAGNMANKSMWKSRYAPVHLPNCDILDKFGFYLPNHQDLSEEDIDLICSKVNNL